MEPSTWHTRGAAVDIGDMLASPAVLSMLAKPEPLPRKAIVRTAANMRERDRMLTIPSTSFS
jgi:hypothetical protein